MVKQILQKNLQQIGEICECVNGDEALANIVSFKPDWVLMDIQLNGMNGLIAAERILQIKPAVKIAFVTQYDDPAYREIAEKIGARAYVLKDNLLELVAIVKNVL